MVPRITEYSQLIACSVLCVVLAAPPPAMASADQAQALQERVEQLERDLAAARNELEKVKASEQAAQGELSNLKEEAATSESSASDKIAIGDGASGTLTIGGAIRANYAWGDYGPSSGAPSRASGDNGNMELDMFRINLDYQNDDFIGKAEYRFYDGYRMLHTGWLGYNFEDGSQVQVGVNRVPFGPGPYGVSQSWFFDQHYYVGLADDMDLGIKYSVPLGSWKVDLAYYYSDEGNWSGASADSARYSYDVVNESGSGYEERNQFNVRGIYSFEDVIVPSDVGFSLQYGELKSKGTQDDGDHYAASVHMVNKWNNFTLASQLTKYKYDIDAYTPFTSTTAPTPTDEVIQFGAFDFPSLAATEAWIPAVSLSYYKAAPSIQWLDYVIPYVEYSSIIKEQSDFNDSDLATFGAAWGSGGWYIYTEVAYSTGNEFVGGETAFGDRLGANADDNGQVRYNINLGYYF